MRIIDLSQQISSSTQVFPPYPIPTFLPWTKKAIQGFDAEVLFLCSHTGTHVDAPSHFIEGGKSVEELGVEAFIGEALLLDLGEVKGRTRIGREALERAQGEAKIKEGDIVLLRTAWDHHLGEASYLNDNPGLSAEAAEYLVELGVKLVGIDVANIDHPDAKDFPVHKILLAKDVPIIENLMGLGRLDKRRFNFVGLPLNLRGSTGSPIRAVAIEP